MPIDSASAVIATNTVRAREEDVAYAVACVTVFAQLPMLIPVAEAALLRLGPEA